jgi:4-hydroxybenzoyl-CoA thioesterase
MSFATTAKVRFAHVDAAGIVFYPRYFEMLNSAVEDWFEHMGHDFRQMHLIDHIGVPMVKLDVTFTSPSRLGDELTITITPVEIGRSSCAMRVLFSGEGRERLRADAVLVCMDLAAQRSAPWPETLRDRMMGSLMKAV